MSKDKDMIKLKAIKLTLLGDSSIGKTCLIFNFINGEFDENTIASIGISKYDKNIKLDNGEDIRLIIFDTAGQERFRGMELSYAQNSQCVILVFDLSCIYSFYNLENWIQELKETFNINYLEIIIFGNKCDLTEKRARRNRIFCK